MFDRILIANRGEIAVRIIRACQELGIETVAVYSNADADSLHVQIADKAICIGPAPALDSYLSIQNILSATVLSGATAIHPGYGLLSENAKFAKICKRCNITFIGPDAQTIDMMGNKLEARKTMINANVPIIPGSTKKIETLENAIHDANNAGYPVLVKAAAGGGGRGIRRVDCDEQMQGAIEGAKAEAMACFGDDTLYIEKMIFNSRHIEVQILSDAFGNHIHLFERDCSLQMRRQKLVEEAPSTFINESLRKQICESALKAAKAVDYIGAGTIEFLVDNNSNYYFMEMNTRLQVEHTVTEMISGIDIVKEQIKIASGEKLKISQKDVKINGHSIECRINAVDADKNFMPSCGTIQLIHTPSGPGVRFDTMIYNGCKIVPHYDSMIGKVVVHAQSRTEAIARMKRALNELVILGISTNIDFQLSLVQSAEFFSGEFDISTVENTFLKSK